MTLAGDRHAARVGESLLEAVGLSEWASTDEDGYVAAARCLAADRPQLAALRASLRDKMAASPLTDGLGFTRALEDAYGALWRAQALNEKG